MILNSLIYAIVGKRVFSKMSCQQLNFNTKILKISKIHSMSNSYEDYRQSNSYED